jgi:hypothetical protein
MFRNFFKKLYYVLAMCMPLMCEARIIETPHIADVVPLIDDDTWVLVDLDNTLFEAKQAMGHANWVYDQLEQRLNQGATREEAFLAFHPTWIKLQEKCPVKPLEEDFVPLLKQFQKKGIVVLGLTHRPPAVAKATLNQVTSLDFDFKETAPTKDSFCVPSSHPTQYVDGILFVGDFNKKGDVFLPFLSIIEKFPKKIVFIDDKKKNVEELEKAFSGRGVEFIGIYYTAIQYAPQIYSREIADFQHRFLDTVLSNEEAILLMQAEEQK